MGKTVRIPISPALNGHNGPITHAMVREPTFEEYLTHGDPFVFVPLRSGGAFPSENADVIKAYIGILVVEPEPLLLPQGGMKLARDIKEAVLGFFLPGGEASEVSPTSPMSSPSGA